MRDEGGFSNRAGVRDSGTTPDRARTATCGVTLFTVLEVTVRSLRILLALVATLAAACSGDGGTAPAPVITAPTINTPSTMIYIGQSVQFSATGGGTIRWGGDAPQVATVDSTTGRVTGVGIGRVTIWAENSGGRTTRLLRGLPSYAGSWQGSYAITGCQSTGTMAVIGFCGNFFQGQVLNMQLQIEQTEDRVSGTFALGGNAGSLNSATVAEGGILPLTGLFTSSNGTIRLDNARLESATAGTITGRFDQTWTISGATGFGILSCEIRNLTRTSGGPTFLAPASTENVTIEEMIRRALRKN